MTVPAGHVATAAIRTAEATATQLRIIYRVFIISSTSRLVDHQHRFIFLHTTGQKFFGGCILDPDQIPRRAL